MDARANCSGNAFGSCAEVQHGAYGGFQNAVQGALPTCVRRTNDTRLGIGEQNGGAVSGENAERDTPFVGHHGVGLGRVLTRLPRLLDPDHVG